MVDANEAQKNAVWDVEAGQNNSGDGKDDTAHKKRGPTAIEKLAAGMNGEQALLGFTDLRRLPIAGALDPPVVYKKLAAIGELKSRNTWWYLMLNSWFAGAYLALGGMLFMAVGAQLYGIKKSDPGLASLLVGAFGLPFGLTMIVLTGAELFTSNTTYMPAAYYEGKCTLVAWIKNWVLSYMFNFLGCLLLAWCFYHANLFDGPATAAIRAIAVKKVSQPFHAIFIRGIMCNWLVNVAVWQATAAQDIAGKILAIFLPISAFVTIGFEHCVANMFTIMFGMIMGADVSVGQFLGKNLIPTTLGNIFAGWFLMATCYGVLYGSVVPKVTLWVKQRLN